MYRKKTAILLLFLTLLGLSLSSCQDEGPASLEQASPLPPFPVGSAVEWLQENGNPLRSLDSEDYSDLQFLKSVIGEKRIVQLGDGKYSGTAEFHKVRVRISKFLHEEMGFDVVAFEGSVFECFQADREAGELPATRLMSDCLHPNWRTREIQTLFEYIKETRAGEKPLRLAGFDMKPSGESWEGRAQFLTETVGLLDPDLASQVEEWEETITQPDLFKSLVKRLGKGLPVFYNQYEGLLHWFDSQEDELATLFPDEPEVPSAARQLVWSTLSLLEYVQAFSSGCQANEIRDRGMAVNISRLVEDAFPDKKVIVWTHNEQLRHNNTNTSERMSAWTYRRGPTGCTTMGEEIASRYRLRGGVYSIGLYLYEGTLRPAYDWRWTWRLGDLGTIPPREPESLEGHLFEAGEPFFFLDLLYPDFETTPTWLKSETFTRETGYRGLFMVPREQYDGLLFIRTVTPSSYILQW